MCNIFLCCDTVCINSNFLSENWAGIIVGILTGFLVTIVVFGLQKLSLFMNTRKFQIYNGNYNCYQKDDSTKKSVSDINITVSYNKMTIKGTRTVDKSNTIGVIELNMTIPEYGKGYYHHTDLTGWGFYEIQIRSEKEILVHAPYFKNHNQINQAFIWEKEG